MRANSEDRWLLLQKEDRQRIFNTKFNFWFIFIILIPFLPLLDMLRFRLYARAAVTYLPLPLLGLTVESENGVMALIVYYGLLIYHWISRKEDGLKNLLKIGWDIRASSNSKASRDAILQWLDGEKLNKDQFRMLLLRHRIEK